MTQAAGSGWWRPGCPQDFVVGGPATPKMRFRAAFPPPSIRAMKPSKLQPSIPWRGIRMRRVAAFADPDGDARVVTIPAAWDDTAAAALAELAPGEGPVGLERAAEFWLRPIAERARQAGYAPDLASRLRALLLARRGAPTAPVWRGATGTEPGFCLNLAAFHDTAIGFDLPGFVAAVETATWAVALACPSSARIGVGFADLAGLLAALGIDYDSPAARDLAAGLATLLRAVAEATSADLADKFGAVAVATPLPAGPAATAVPGLVAKLAEARRLAAARPARRHEATTSLAAPGLAEALLGVETGGIAPSFSPLDDAGRLNRAARASLSARGITPEAAVALLLAGHSPFPPASAAAHAAMHAAVAPFVQRLPVAPPVLTAPDLAAPRTAVPRRRDLPARHAGATQKASIAGHRLFLRTGEHADGTLGEISIAMPKESPAFRGLLDAFGQAVSLGLQHGVPLDEFVESFVATRFGAAGPVEGDVAVTRATSVLDYVFRSLAAHYLGRVDLPQPEVEEEPAAPPLLPLDFPRDEPPRRRLRVVK